MSRSDGGVSSTRAPVTGTLTVIHGGSPCVEYVRCSPHTLVIMTNDSSYLQTKSAWVAAALFQGQRCAAWWSVKGVSSRRLSVKHDVYALERM